jgi:hypothetical protein
MSSARDELHELVEQLPEDEVPVVLAEVSSTCRACGEAVMAAGVLRCGRSKPV